jgi:endonuclease/exonuclease/phosphatase family metal-dependent hydrolase
MEETNNPLRVMSFNIRTSTARDIRFAWDLRKHLVIERIHVFDPDLLGIQECQEGEQADFMRSQLPEYEFLGVRRGDDSRTGGEMAPIMFRKERFELLDSGHFWLSKNPETQGSKLFGAVFPRTVTWAKLQPREMPDQPLFFFNTHFDYVPLILASMARVLRRRILAITTGDPSVLTGDFNTPSGGAAHRILTKPYGDLDGTGEREGPVVVYSLVDTEAHIDETGEGKEGTIHKFGRINRPIVIDWILASNHFTVLDSQVDTFEDNGLYPSDHFPVTATLQLETEK